MPNSTPSEPDSGLADFIERVSGNDALRIEEDFGQGFVRLRLSEAEKRQAAQDIRSSEDVVLELLRNSRDAGASNIYIATSKTSDIRNITVLDDGDGIPDEMREIIFQPRVTSKLDTGHMDKWGFHGRGMALYSISQNSKEHRVAYSSVGEGTSIKVSLSMGHVGEKRDQSSYPYFDISDGTYLMRGPKNINRVACEFAMEDINGPDVYIGTATEITATLFSKGIHSLPARTRLFSRPDALSSPAQLLAFSEDDGALVKNASMLGLSISKRSARRILDGEISPKSPIMEIVERAIYESGGRGYASNRKPSLKGECSAYSQFRPRISRSDLDELKASMSDSLRSLSEKYYLQKTDPRISIKRGKIVVEYDILPEDGI